MMMQAQTQIPPPTEAMTFDPAERAERLLNLPFQREHARALVQHWLDIAGDRLVPRKTDIRPECIKEALPYLVMYEYIDARTILFRLAGTGTRTAYKRELTGLNYLDFVPEDMREGASARLHGIVNQPAAQLTSLIGPAGKDIKGLYEVMGLPLMDGEGRIRFSVHTTELIEMGSRIEGQGRSLLQSAQSTFHDIGAGVPVGIVGTE